MIHGMNHFTVIAQDLQRTVDFYGMLGLRPGPRPDLGFAGAWLYAGGDTAILHVYGDRPVPPQVAGVIDHMAFSARGLRAVKERLDAEGWPYQLRQQPGSGTWQLFCHDPSGAKVELDFAPDEQA
ncbi:MAG: glyoxalase [Comamonadaceae bacterium]|nr:MAG: glyoxalase [Comamonadaceae bacterium]